MALSETQVKEYSCSNTYISDRDSYIDRYGQILSFMTLHDNEISEQYLYAVTFSILNYKDFYPENIEYKVRHMEKIAFINNLGVYVNTVYSLVFIKMHIQ